MFRWFFRIDACVMIAVGLLLLGWHDLFVRPRLGLPPTLSSLRPTSSQPISSGWLTAPYR